MASSVKCSADEMGNMLIQIVGGYAEDQREKVNKAVSAGAKATKRTLASNSPTRTGAYAKGWRIKNSYGVGGKKAVVYQAKKPGLTHLLEHGHGGPHPAGAHPHVEFAYEVGRQVLEQELA